MNVQLIPIFTDNYVFCFQDEKQNAGLIDPGDAEPCLKFLREHELNLTNILITHHHSDHIGGVLELKSKFPDCQITAPILNKNEISFASDYCGDGDLVQACGFDFSVFNLPGHTNGHIGYFNSESAILFSGDVVFGLGCGRLFEGTPQQMFQSISKIKALPSRTKIYCTHEYTERNLQFAESLKANVNLTETMQRIFIKKDFSPPASQIRLKRAQNQPTVPLVLEAEQNFNPFFLAPTVEDFANLRSLRNHF